MLAQLTVKPLLIACGVLLAVVLGLIGALVVQGSRHDAAYAKLQTTANTCATERDAATTKVGELARANASQQQAIEGLASRLDAAITETERLDELLTNAEDAAALAHAERERALGALNDLREITYATDPSCAAWGAAPVCAAISGGVQERWRQATAAARGD